MRFSALISCLFLILCAAPPAEGAWGGDGVSARPASQNAQSVVTVPDGTGGVYLVWDETTPTKVYAQRLSALGVRQWGLDGIQIGDGHLSVACSDGAGGLIVALAYTRIRVQRFSSAGSPQWVAGGLALNADSQGGRPALCSDGAGGAFVTWESNTLGSFDVFAQHVNAGGVAQWAANGVRVTTLASSQTRPAITSGQSGSAVLMWVDNRNTNDAIYAQRLLDPSGANAWTGNGVAVCNASGTRSGIALVADGDGAFATWTDDRAGAGLSRAYMQRVSATNGASLWQPDGQLVATGGSGLTLQPAPVASGSGIVVCWEDARNGARDIYAQRYDASGVAQWSGDVALSQETTDETSPVAVSDGSGGALAAWRHWAAGGLVFGRMGRIAVDGAVPWHVDGIAINVSSAMSPTSVPAIASDGAGGAIAGLLGAGTGMPHAQRVMANANLADYDATIINAIDLPSDEGGYVRVAVSGAFGDLAPGDPPVIGYNVWRRISAAETGSSTASPANRAAGSTLQSWPPGTRLDRAATAGLGLPPGSWESLGMTGAFGLPTYWIAAPTRADSTGSGPADETFVVTVHSTSSVLSGVSNTVVAHSVDNLAPAPPQNVAGAATAAHTITLSWNANPESDLAWYAVYRGATPEFVPAPGNRIATPVSPGYVDPGYTSHFVYKVSAVDRHGNESIVTPFDPTSQVGVEPAPLPRSVTLAGAAPNPATVSTEFEWSLPRATRVHFEIFDVHGRRVRDLFSGAQPAGARRIRWDVLDGSGAPVPAGVYLARLEADGETRERTFVVVPSR